MMTGFQRSHLKPVMGGGEALGGTGPTPSKTTTMGPKNKSNTSLAAAVNGARSLYNRPSDSALVMDWPVDVDGESERTCPPSVHTDGAPSEEGSASTFSDTPTSKKMFYKSGGGLRQATKLFRSSSDNNLNKYLEANEGKPRDTLNFSSANSTTTSTAVPSLSTSSAKRVLIGRSKKTMISLEGKARELMLRKWGECFLEMEEKVSHIFTDLDCENQELYPDEFKRCMGIMGVISSNFSTHLFNIVDVDKSGTISFKEFLDWLLIMTHGSEEQKLFFGFRLCDRDGDGRISRSDLLTTILSLYEIMTGLRMEENVMDVSKFCEEVFQRMGVQEKGVIEWEDFKTGAKHVSPYIRTLGSRSLPCQTSATRCRNKILIGGQKWRFVLSMILGLESAVRKINPVSGGIEQDDDDGGGSLDDNASTCTVTTSCPELDSTKSVKKESFNIPTSDDTICSITAYGQEDFRAVRSALGISDDDYLLSVGVRQVIGSMLLGDLFGMSEQVSEGKSGSMFYWSHDGRFMIKSISRAESLTMRRILSSYKEHVSRHPNTLLMKLLGLYRLRVNSEKYDIVVIQNIFETSKVIHERFDLKGSMYERCVGRRKRCLPGVVMKDKDFVELGRKIRVGPELARKIKQQVRVDSTFLADNGIIDYSFLIGVHYAERNVSEEDWVVLNKEELRATFDRFKEIRGKFFLKDLDFDQFAHYAYLHQDFPTKEGLPPAVEVVPPLVTEFNPRKGIPVLPASDSEDEPQQYVYFGIIDTLVPFNSRKKGEFVLKSIVQYGQNFSVVPPRDYSERFISFITDQIC